MTKLESFFRQLVDVRPDIKDHFVLGVYCLVFCFVIRAFLGKFAGKIACIFCILGFIAWEIFTSKSLKESITDAMASIIPVGIYLLEITKEE